MIGRKDEPSFEARLECNGIEDGWWEESVGSRAPDVGVKREQFETEGLVHLVVGEEGFGIGGDEGR
jgi:hypothetical protein